MSSINVNCSPNNYFVLQYLERVLANALEIRNEVLAHEQPVAPIRPDVLGEVRLRLYDEIFDFVSEAVEAAQSIDFAGAHRQNTTCLNLLSYSTLVVDGEASGRPTLNKRTYQPPALPIIEHEPCGCTKVKCETCSNSDLTERDAEAGSSDDQLIIECRPTTGHRTSSVGLPLSMLDFRLSLLMPDVPALWDNLPADETSSEGSTLSTSDFQLPSVPGDSLPASPPESHLSSLSSLNLRGPSVFKSQVLLQPPKHIEEVRDAHFHSTGSFLCSWAGKPASRGLWFQSKQIKQWEKVARGQFYGMCSSYRETEAFAVSGEEGDNWVKKYDLKTGTPLQTGSLGYFQVCGGEMLIDIAMSYGGRLAVSDYVAKRVTVHEPSGDLVCELKEEKLEGGLPFRLCWFNGEEEKLLVKVYGREDSIFFSRTLCFLIPSGDLMWKSEIFTDQWGWPIYCREDRVYFVAGDEPPLSIRVLSGESGEKIQESRLEEKAQPYRVMDVDGQLTVVCFKRTNK